jgi:putative transposase
MKKKRFTETQIFSILKEFDAGKNIQELSREQGVSKATIYNWKAKYGGMEMNELKKYKDLEEENRNSNRCMLILHWTTKCLRMFLEKSSKAR